MYVVVAEERVLRELYLVAIDAGRPRVTVPSVDLDLVAGVAGGRHLAEDALQRLASADRVVRVRRDLVVLPEASGLLRMDLPALLDAALDVPYLITGGAALEHHDLTDQHYFTLSVLVPSQMRKFRFHGQTAAFFLTDPGNIWGAVPGDGPRFASPERTLVDVLNHPRYAVSTIQALDALLAAVDRDQSFLDRLHATVVRYGAGARSHGSRAAARRVGLVVERLFGEDAAAPYRDLIGLNRTPTLLRPRGASSGTLDRRWRVLVNTILEPETVR